MQQSMILVLASQYLFGGALVLGQVSQSELGEEAPPALTISQFAPTPKLTANATNVTQARFAVVDAHSHFRYRLRHNSEMLEQFVALMDRNNIALCVSLDGKLGDQLSEHCEFLWSRYEDRFVIYANIDWQGDGRRDDPASWDCHRDDFSHRMVRALEDAKERGVSGVKVFKSFGLSYKNPDGSFIEIDDRRFDAIWEVCGKLGLPVIMHTADPSAFFDPITPQNERYEELMRHPDWHFPPDRFPSRKALHEARDRLFARHRQTTFIAAHLGNDGEDLSETSQLLVENPNVYVEFGSRISELGRQPYSARDFLIRFQDRVLFGTDGPWPEQRYRYYWRFLETRDEYFPYSEKTVPPQGLWRIYGVYLPDETLVRIYQKNAAKIIPGVAEKLKKYSSMKKE